MCVSFSVNILSSKSKCKGVCVTFKKKMLSLIGCSRRWKKSLYDTTHTRVDNIYTWKEKRKYFRFLNLVVYKLGKILWLCERIYVYTYVTFRGRTFLADDSSRLKAQKNFHGHKLYHPTRSHFCWINSKSNHFLVVNELKLLIFPKNKILKREILQKKQIFILKKVQ